MVETQEQAPIPVERLQSVAQWLETRVRPVMHEVVTDDSIDMTEFEQEFEVRDYQLEAWARLEDARAAGRTRVLGELATGLGKTFVAAVDVMRYREECAAMDPPMVPRILYVSHKNEINKQAAETFEGLMPDLEVDFFKTGRKQMREADITFATIQSLYSELDRFDPQDYEYIIWDESHHLEAETYKAVRDYFDPLFEHAITATVERMDGKDIKEYFGESLYKKTLPEGIAEGWLADVDYHIIFDQAIKDEIAKGFNPKTLQEIKDLFKEKAPTEAIAQNIKDEIERLGLSNPKTMIFCESIDEANVMAELLDGAAYHSFTEDPETTLQDFKSGRRPIITTMDMFNEGVNIPDTEVVVFLRATQSGPIFEQQLGRGLRRTRGKEKVYVLDFVANIERIEKVRELSRSIRRRAQELGQETSEAGLIYDGSTKAEAFEDEERSGLHVHSTHGEFDFDKIAVDLLERWGAMNAWKVDAGDFRSVNKAAAELGIARDTLVKLCAEHGLVLQERRFKTRMGYALDSAQFQTLKDALHSEEAVYGVYTLAAELGIGSRTIKQLAEKVGIELERRSIKGAKLSVTITQSQLDQLKERFPNTFLEKPAKGWLSITAAAKKYGVDASVIEKSIEHNQWELPLRKFNAGAFKALSPEQLAQISTTLVPAAPEGARSIKGLSRELGVSDVTLKKVASEEGMNLNQFKFGKQVALGLPREQVLQMTTIVNKSKLPQGHIPVSQAAKSLGVNEATIMRQVEEFGWTLKAYRFGENSGRTYGISSEQVEMLRQSDRIQKASKKR